VGLAYRSRNPAIWVALIAYIFAGILESMLVIQTDRVLFRYGPILGMADLVMSIALCSFMLRDLPRWLRLRLLILAITYGISGIYSGTLIWIMADLSSADVFQIYGSVESGTSDLLFAEYMEMGYLTFLVVMLAAFPFLELNAPGWKLANSPGTVSADS
tara:strand:- start:36830 stop:37306 length:477 start_codon:yes stop_codon:yes gene_type:complete